MNPAMVPVPAPTAEAGEKILRPDLDPAHEMHHSPSRLLTFERSYDYDLVRRIVTHPKVYRRGLLSDSHPPREQWRPPEDEKIWFVIPRDERGPLAALIFEPENSVCYQTHVAFLPRAWGRSVEISLGCIEWLRQTTNWLRLICCIPDYNRLAVRLARKTGFELRTVKHHSLCHNGQSASQLIYERWL